MNMNCVIENDYPTSIVQHLGILFNLWYLWYHGTYKAVLNNCCSGVPGVSPEANMGLVDQGYGCHRGTVEVWFSAE